MFYRIPGMPCLTARQLVFVSAAGEAGGVPRVKTWIALHSDNLKMSLETFFEAVDAKLKGDQSPKTDFDDYDIIVLDNNLSTLGIKGARLTAEAIAGYIRAITNSPCV